MAPKNKHAEEFKGELGLKSFSRDLKLEKSPEFPLLPIYASYYPTVVEEYYQLFAVRKSNRERWIRPRDVDQHKVAFKDINEHYGSEWIWRKPEPRTIGAEKCVANDGIIGHRMLYEWSSTWVRPISRNGRVTMSQAISDF